MIILVGLIALCIVLMVLKRLGYRKPAPVVRPMAAVQRSPDSPVVVPLNDTRVLLRIPDELRNRLLDAAMLNGRPMTSEIVARLEASLAAEDLRRAPGD